MEEDDSLFWVCADFFLDSDATQIYTFFNCCNTIARSMQLNRRESRPMATAKKTATKKVAATVEKAPAKKAAKKCAKKC
jgi:hypothetical protein